MHIIIAEVLQFRSEFNCLTEIVTGLETLIARLPPALSVRHNHISHNSSYHAPLLRVELSIQGSEPQRKVRY